MDVLEFDIVHDRAVPQSHRRVATEDMSVTLDRNTRENNHLTGILHVRKEFDNVTGLGGLGGTAEGQEGLRTNLGDRFNSAVRQRRDNLAALAEGQRLLRNEFTTESLVFQSLDLNTDIRGGIRHYGHIYNQNSTFCNFDPVQTESDLVNHGISRKSPCGNVKGTGGSKDRRLGDQTYFRGRNRFRNRQFHTDEARP